MEVSPFLPLSDGLYIEQVTAEASELLVHVVSQSSKACCPLCGVLASRIHSRYTRRMADLPCAGQQVTLLLTVRKFFCPNPVCPRTIFAEQFPDLVQAYARITNRLRDALLALGFATCAEVTSRLAPKLGMVVTPTTIIRRVRAVPVSQAGKVRVLGVDDFAWKKGQTYGTILVDLEVHRTIDLLPDRAEETLEAWLHAHPEVEIISRDRGGEYAAAARKGAPQAQQVADRFHVVKNLREGLKDLMERKQSCLPEAEEYASTAIPQKAQGRKDGAVPQAMEHEKRYRKMGLHLRPSARDMSYDALRTHLRQDNRYARYQAVRMLHQQGLSLREISRRLKICRETIRRFVRAESFPERSKPPKKASLLDPYKPYILQRWQQGCCNGAQLYDEIKVRGYTGSGPLLRIFLRDLRKKQQEAEETSSELPSLLPPTPPLKQRMSPTRVSWLFVSQPSKLDEKQQRHVKGIRAAHPDLDMAYQLSQSFLRMLTERRGSDLDAWLNQAEQSGIVELKRFATGIRRDYAAVRAAFSSGWSNGQVEAQVNCLKLQKRLMFGRAKFDLLRQRVLSRA